jgi:Short C-terminal domain
MVLIVLASLIGFFSVFALWAKRQALETETWTETSSKLLENEEIRDAIADFLITQLYANVDVQGEIEKRLPPEIRGLAGPAAGGLRQAGGEVARTALEQPKVQAAWEKANRTAHKQLLAVIDDESAALSTTGGVVTLDLKVILGTVASQVGISQGLVDKLPADAAQLEVLRSDQLEAAQDGVRALRFLAWFLTALALVLYAIAIYINRDRRRETLRNVGVSLVIVGILVLFAHGLAGNAVVGALTETAASEGPVQATWDIGTSLLVETGQAIIAYGIVIVLAAWIAGPSTAATWVRGGVTPYLRQPRFAYGGLVLALALIFWWQPTQATQRLIPSLLLVGLLALGVEVLRRQVIREFPDRVTTWSPEGTAQALAERMRERRERRVATGTAVAASPDEQRLAQLERLGRLHESGVLSDEELAAEKKRILESTG